LAKLTVADRFAKKKMKKILFIIALIWFVQSSSGGNKLTSSWLDSLQNKDSRLSFQYDEDSKLLYRISNDKDFLHIDLIADQEELKRTLLFSGLNIWIDSTAKAKELQGLQLVSSQFPPQNRGQHPMSGNKPPEPGQNSFDKKMDFNKMMSLETIGLAFELVDYIIHPDSLGGVYFSFKIPVEKITRKNQTPTVLSLIIESTGMEGETNMSGGPGGGPGGGMMQGGIGGGQGMPSGGQGMQGGGGPGGPGGGQGGGPGGPPPGNQSQDIKIKIKKLQLATNEYAK
jgi:hypothetical protein